MAFFDDLKVKMTVKGKQAAEKAKDLTEVVRMKTQIASEKNAITVQYNAIGKKAVEVPAEGDEERFAEELAAIRAAQEKIAELEAQLSELDGSVTCPTCGARVEKKDAFCSKCGTKVEHEEACECECEEEIFEEAAEKVAEVVEEAKATVAEVVEEATE